VVTLLAVAAAVAIGFGQLDVTMAATARQTLGAPARVGLLFTAISGGSAVGGLVYGSRTWPWAEAARLPVVVAGFATGLAVMAAVLAVMVPPLWLLLVVLFLAGVWIAPAVIIAGNLVDHYAPGDRLNEAQSWLNTGFTSGGAAGTALAGWLVDAGGPAWAATGAAVAMTVAAVVGVAGQRVWRGGAQAGPTRWAAACRQDGVPPEGTPSSHPGGAKIMNTSK
jgi:MFS family permease